MGDEYVPSVCLISVYMLGDHLLQVMLLSGMYWPSKLSPSARMCEYVVYRRQDSEVWP